MLAGIIPAAGLSSRMPGFKPLLPLGGSPMIARSIRAMQGGGVEDLWVVLGKNAEELIPIVESCGARWVINPHYETTDMLASIQLGLSQLHDPQGVFFAPCDMPAIAPKTFFAVRQFAQNTRAPAVFPYRAGEAKTAHPPYLRGDLVPALIAYQGEGGLKGGLTSLGAQKLLVGDPGASMDADRAEDYEALCAYVQKTSGLSRAACAALWEEYELLPHIRRHCTAVADVAFAIALALARCGVPLDLTLVDSGAMLHDLCRLQHRHAHYGAKELEKKGYLALAQVVAGHDHIDVTVELNETQVVFLADKIVRETGPVTITERYRPALERFGSDPVISKDILTQRGNAERLRELFEQAAGQSLYALSESVLQQRA